MQNEKLDQTDYNLPLYRKLDENSAITPIVTPDNPPWSSPAAVGVWLASVAFIVILPTIFVIPYLVVKNVGLSNSAQMVDFLKNDPTAIFLQIVSNIPAHILTIGVAWLVVTQGRKYPFLDTLGWKSGDFRSWMTIPFIAGFFALAYVMTLIFGEQDNEFMRILRSSSATVYAVAFLATFTAPFVEEVVYRGILFSAFRKSFGVTWAVIAATTVFALVHFLQYWGSPATLILICLLSLCLTLIRAKTHNLLPCFVLHTVFNGIQSIMLVIGANMPDASSQNETKAAMFMHLFK